MFDTSGLSLQYEVPKPAGGPNSDGKMHDKILKGYNIELNVRSYLPKKSFAAFTCHSIKVKASSFVSANTTNTGNVPIKVIDWIREGWARGCHVLHFYVRNSRQVINFLTTLF